MPLAHHTGGQARWTQSAESFTLSKVNEPHAFHEHFSHEILVSSRGEACAGMTVDQVQVPGGTSGTMPAFPFYTVSTITKGSCEAEACLGGVDYRGVMRVGSVSIVPAGTSSTFACDHDNDVTLVSVSRALEEAANELRTEPCGRRDVPVVFNSRNDTIESLSALLVSQLSQQRHPAQRLIYDGASQAFAAELIRISDDDTIDPPETPAGLPPKTLAKVLQHIDERLSDSISLNDLAIVANVSRFHFLKLFKLSTGVTPMAYVERSRVRRSQELICAGRMELTEIALAVGFADQSHFTHRFRRYTGRTPGDFRQERARRVVPTN